VIGFHYFNYIHLEHDIRNKPSTYNMQRISNQTKQMVKSLPEQKEAQASNSCPPYIVINI